MCPVGWFHALVSVIWEDFRKDVYWFLIRGRKRK